MEMTGGGLHIEYTPSAGVFLSYRDKTPLTTCIQNVQYADNLTLVAENRKELQQMLDALDRSCTRWGMRISGNKTKVLGIGEPPRDHPAITLKGQALDEVDSFSYLGSEVEQTSRAKKDVKMRVEKSATIYQMWRRKVFRSRNLNRRTQVQVFRTMVTLVLLYGAETCSLTQQDTRRLKTFQMRCLRDIVGVTLWDMRRNVDILEETGELAIKEQLRLKRLQWIRHLQRMPDHQLQKQLLWCRLRGKKRRPGGTCLWWVDVISKS